jgi:hypothetical protein
MLLLKKSAFSTGSGVQKKNAALRRRSAGRNWSDLKRTRIWTPYAREILKAYYSVEVLRKKNSSKKRRSDSSSKR